VASRVENLSGAPVVDARFAGARKSRALRSRVRGQALVGKVGTVVGAVRGGDRPGEVRVVVAGIAHYYLAYAETAVPAGTEVLIINFRGARQVDVEPWPRMPADDHAPQSTERPQ
jgi:membrane protein implicated in regulation of membrane protease activity